MTQTRWYKITHVEQLFHHARPKQSTRINESGQFINFENRFCLPKVTSAGNVSIAHISNSIRVGFPIDSPGIKQMFSAILGSSRKNTSFEQFKFFSLFPQKGTCLMSFFGCSSLAFWICFPEILRLQKVMALAPFLF